MPDQFDSPVEGVIGIVIALKTFDIHKGNRDGLRWRNGKLSSLSVLRKSLRLCGAGRSMQQIGFLRPLR